MMRRVLALSARDRLLLVRAFVSLAVIDVVLRVRGLAPLMEWVSKRSRVRTADRGAFQRASRYAHWIDVAAEHHPVRARCLHRSLTLHAWLIGEGLQSELRIGVRRHGTEITAHAWVEVDGVPANERP